MLYEIDNETIDFLCKYKLTLNQFAICLLIHKKDTATMMRINNEIGIIGNYLIPNGVDTQGKKRYIKEIDDLIDRNFLRLTFIDKDDKYALDNFEVTNKFTDEFIQEVDMFEELWMEYPKFLFVNGLEFPAKSADYDELEQKYLKLIKNSKKKHKEIIDKLQQFKSTNTYAQMGIEKFIGSRQWDNITGEIKNLSRLV
jgi:hypothetical protein